MKRFSLKGFGLTNWIVPTGAAAVFALLNFHSQQALEPPRQASRLAEQSAPLGIVNRLEQKSISAQVIEQLNQPFELVDNTLPQAFISRSELPDQWPETSKDLVSQFQHPNTDYWREQLRAHREQERSPGWLKFEAYTLAQGRDLLAMPTFQQMAASEHLSANVIVKLEPGAATHSVNRLGLEHERQLGGDLVDGLHRYSVSEQTDAASLIDAINAHPQVIYAELDYLIEPALVPNDSNVTASDWWLDQIDAYDAWDIATDATAIGPIGIMEPGFLKTHEDIADNLWVNIGETLNGLDDDNNGYIDDINGLVIQAGGATDHGTPVAASICAQGNNNLGYVGSAWDCELMELSANTGITGVASDFAIALPYAVANGSRISNHSWTLAQYSHLVADTIDAAETADHLVVVSAGNDAQDLDAGYPVYPATLKNHNILAVAASTQAEAVATYSNWGVTSVDIAAPSGFATASNDGTYGVFSGTSQATAVVTGAVALAWSQAPDWTFNEIKQVLLDTARPISALTDSTVSGGVLDMHALMQRAYDFDNDGLANSVDTDDDNDGTADGSDAFVIDANESIDTDGDGIGDNSDPYPNDPTRSHYLGWSHSDKEPSIILSNNGSEISLAEGGPAVSALRSSSPIRSGDGIYYLEVEDVIGSTGFGIGVATASAPLSVDSFEAFFGRSDVQLLSGAADTLGLVVDYRGAYPLIHLFGDNGAGLELLGTRALVVGEEPVYLYLATYRNDAGGLQQRLNLDPSGNSFVYDPAAAISLAMYNGASQLKYGWPSTRPDPTIAITETHQLVIAGSSISFNAVASDANSNDISANITWALDGTTIGSGASISPATTTAGTYTLTASISDAAQLRSTETVTLHVIAASGSDELDHDLDGLSYVEETLAGTDPALFDSDGDGLSDGHEVNVGSNPNDAADPTSSNIETHQSFVGFHFERAATSPAVSTSDDGLSVGYILDLNQKSAIRANQGMRGEFRYWEGRAVSDDYDMGFGLIGPTAVINDYCCVTEPADYNNAPPSAAVNTLGGNGVWRNLVWQSNFESNDAYVGFAVDYRGSQPTVYVIGSTGVQAVLTLADFNTSEPVFPMVYGNANIERAPIAVQYANFGQQPFYYDVNRALTDYGIDTTDLVPGWGLYRQHQQLRITGTVFEAITDVPNTISAVALNVQGLDNSSAISWRVLNQSGIDITASIATGPASGASLNYTPTVIETLTVIAQITDSKTGQTIERSVNVSTRADLDSDGDGLGDSVDPFPNDPTNNSDNSQWLFCADEGAVCSVSGLAEVRYGANTTFTTPSNTASSIDCNNDTFGDPIPFVFKRCEYRLISTTADSDGDGTPDINDAFPSDPTEVADTDGDGVGDNADTHPNDPNNGDITRWTVCATEGGVCAVPEASTVRYGGEGTYFEQENVTGSIDCNNDIFGDPVFGVVKRCEYRLAAATLDSDGDGVLDVVDAYPNDPTRSEFIGWSTTDKDSAVILSGNNLDVTIQEGGPAVSAVRLNHPIRSGDGLYYLEIEDLIGTTGYGIGIATPTAPLSVDSFEDFFSRSDVEVLSNGADVLGLAVDYRGAYPVIHLFADNGAGIEHLGTRVLNVSEPVYLYLATYRNDLGGLQQRLNLDPTGASFTYDPVAAVETGIFNAGNELQYGWPSTRSKPVLTITESHQLVTVGDSVSFSATASDATSTDISADIVWTLDGVHIGTGNAVSPATTTAGSYILTASIADLANLRSSQSVNLYIAPVAGGELLDHDHDGLTYTDESLAGTNPALVDTDGDGLSDGHEVANGTNPLDAADPASSTIVSHEDTVRLTFEQNATSPAVTTSDDGLSAGYILYMNEKSAIRANQGMRGEFRYWEGYAPSSDYEMGYGLIGPNAAIDDYCCVSGELTGAPPSMSVNTLGGNGIWRNLVFQQNFDANDDYVGFAVDYRGASPIVYVIGSTGVQRQLELSDFNSAEAIFPMVYGNANIETRGAIGIQTVNFGQQAFHYDVRQALTDFGVDATDLVPGWGLYRQQQHLNLSENFIEVILGGTVNLDASATNAEGLDNGAAVTWTIYDGSNNDVTASLLVSPVGGSVSFTPTVVGTLRVQAQMLDSKTGEQVSKEAVIDVMNDTQAPSIGAVPSDLSITIFSGNSVPASHPDIVAFLAAPFASDNSGSATLTHDAPTTFPLGATVVTFTAQDAAGNQTQASANITILDGDVPVVTVPSNLNIVSPTGVSLAATTPAIAAFLSSASATDTLDGSLPVSHDAPASFPVGITTVSFSATDSSGNTTTVAADVRVIDGTLPVDSDNDGVPDASDAFPNDPTETVDTDNDGVGDNSDQFPTDPTRSIAVGWSSTDKEASITLSADNLDISVELGGPDVSAVRLNYPIQSGDGMYYLEIEDLIGTTGYGIGIATQNAPLSVASFEDFFGRNDVEILSSGADVLGLVVDYRGAYPTIHLFGDHGDGFGMEHFGTRVLDVSEPVYLYLATYRNDLGGLQQRLNLDPTGASFAYDPVSTAELGIFNAGGILKYGWPSSRSNPSIDISETHQLVTVGASVSFNASALDAASSNISSDIVWTLDGTQIGTGASVSPSTANAGSFDLVATITDVANLTSSTTVKLHVAPVVGGDLLDHDHDGLNYSEELLAGTNPALIDSDGDGLSDGHELANSTNPLDAADPVSSTIVAHEDSVRLRFEQDATSPAVTTSDDGLSVGYILYMNEKSAIRANQGMQGEFRYWEGYALSSDYEMGFGLIGPNAAIDDYCCVSGSLTGAPPSMSVNTLGGNGIWRNLVFQQNFDANDDYVGFAVDYRGSTPIVYVIGSTGVQRQLTLTDFNPADAIYPMVYGNANIETRGAIGIQSANFGQQPFNYNVRQALIDFGVDTTDLVPGWGVYRQQQHLQMDELFVETPVNSPVTLMASATDASGADSSSTIIWTVRDANGIDVTGSVVSGSAIGASVTFTPVTMEDFTVHAEITDSKTGQTLTRSAMVTAF